MAVGVLFLTLILMGLIAYARIPLQMMPEGFSGTRLTVMVSHPGSSASENEEKVARVIEEPADAITVDAALAPRAIVDRVLAVLTGGR